MSKVKRVYNLIILDESGSMGIVKKSVINGFNQLCTDIGRIAREHEKQKHFISLSTFNGLGVRNRLACQPVSKIIPLNWRTYQPESNTPLYDAICLSVHNLQSDLNNISKYRVLVTVITDGQENASKGYSLNDTNQIISTLSEDPRWGFGLIGANIDVHDVAKSLAIPLQRTIEFESEGSSVNKMFRRYGNAQLYMANTFERGGDFACDDVPF